MLKQIEFIVVDIRFFGALRPFSSAIPLGLNVKKGISMAELKETIKLHLARSLPDFDQAELIDASALANAKEVLTNEFTLEQDAQLALLPPVCGG